MSRIDVIKRVAITAKTNTEGITKFSPVEKEIFNELLENEVIVKVKVKVVDAIMADIYDKFKPFERDGYTVNVHKMKELYGIDDIY